MNEHMAFPSAASKFSTILSLGKSGKEKMCFNKGLKHT